MCWIFVCRGDIEEYWQLSRKLKRTPLLSCWCSIIRIQTTEFDWDMSQLPMHSSPARTPTSISRFCRFSYILTSYVCTQLHFQAKYTSIFCMNTNKILPKRFTIVCRDIWVKVNTLWGLLSAEVFLREQEPKRKPRWGAAGIRKSGTYHRGDRWSSVNTILALDFPVDWARLSRWMRCISHLAFRHTPSVKTLCVYYDDAQYTGTSCLCNKRRSTQPSWKLG